MRHKKIEVFARGKNDPIGSIPTKKHKIEVREVDSISEAMKEFGGMRGVIKVLNQRLEAHGIQVFRDAIRKGESVRTAKKLTKNRKLELFRNRKKEHDILDGISISAIAGMTENDMHQFISRITGE